MDVLKSGERAQCSGLAAAGAAEQHHHLAGFDVQVEVVERLAGGSRIDLVHVLHADAAAAFGGVLENRLGGLGHGGAQFVVDERFRCFGNSRLLIGESHDYLPSLDVRMAVEIRSSATSSITPNINASSDMAVETCEFDWPSW